MKINHIISSAFLVLSLGATSQAATISTNLNDVILGFKEAGATNNLEVDLGNVSNFISGSYATGSEVTLSQLSGADLTAQFGTWQGTNQVAFGIAGTNGIGGGNTLWASDKNLTTALLAGSSQGTASTAIQTVYTGLNNATSTANSNFAAAILASGPQSWSTQVKSTNNFSAANLNNMATNTTALGTAADGSTSVQLNFYQLLQGGGAAGSTLLGDFKLYDNGTLTFTAIPEPSTYAMILGVFALGFVMLRRRQQVRA